MARLGGMSTESFSSARERLSAASVGLGAILRDQKTMPGSSRSNVLLGFSTQATPVSPHPLSNSPVCSLAASPTESSAFLDADDPDDHHKEEDACLAETKETRNPQYLKEHLGLVHSASHGYDSWNHGYDPTIRHGFSHAHTHIQTHAHQQRHGYGHHDGPKQQMYALECARPARHYVVDKGIDLPDAILTSAASVRRSPLSKLSDSQPLHKPPTRQVLTPSWTIPRTERRTSYDATRHSEHQSAPVNVPNWSKILKQDGNAGGSFGRISDIGEDELERLPPHELLAKEYAQRQSMTSSVCEGHGRTLKGRDMRRVRNAVWRQTGFAD